MNNIYQAQGPRRVYLRSKGISLYRKVLEWCSSPNLSHAYLKRDTFKHFRSGEMDESCEDQEVKWLTRLRLYAPFCSLVAGNGRYNWNLMKKLVVVSFMTMYRVSKYKILFRHGFEFLIEDYGHIHRQLFISLLISHWAYTIKR